MIENLYSEQDQLVTEKWAKVLDSPDINPIEDNETRMGVARMLENTTRFLKNKNIYNEAAPINVAGDISGYDKVVISMVARIGPTIMGNELVGSQPMNGPNGLAFALRPRYADGAGNEIHANIPDTAWSGLSSDGSDGDDGTPVASDTALDPFIGTGFTTGTEKLTAAGEGDVTANIAMTVDSVPVQAKTRALKADFSQEMVQDLASQHNINAESMFGTLLADSLAAEINQQTLRDLYISAVLGAQDTTTPGTYDLDADTDGRWVGEKGKVLAMRIQKEATEIMKTTRAGHGTFAVVDSNTYNLLHSSGLISDFGPSNSQFSGANPVISSNTVGQGMLLGQLKIYRDDYANMNAAGEGMVLVGYKGNSAFDAGYFYCPYIPVWTTNVVDENSGQPRMFYKTRAGRVSNPLADQGGAITARSNPFYRIFKVTNLLF